MLSSVLEASVSGQAQPPVSSVSACQAEFYTEVPSSLLDELKPEGSQHADLEQSFLKSVSGNHWSTEQANTQVREKCRLDCHKHGETPVHCQPVDESPAAEESQNSMDEQLMDATEMQDSIGRDGVESFSQKAASLLQETIKIEAPEETEREVTELDMLQGVTVQNITQHVLAIDTAILDAFKRVTLNSLNNEAHRKLQCGTLELEAGDGLDKAVEVSLKQEAREMLAQVSQKCDNVLEQKARNALVAHEAFECEVGEALEFASHEVMQKEVGEILEQKDFEVEREAQDSLEHETHQVLEYDTLDQTASNALEQETHESLKQAAREVLELGTQNAPNVSQQEVFEAPAVQGAMEFESSEIIEKAVCEVQKWKTCEVQEQAANAVLQLDCKVLEQKAKAALEQDFEALELASKAELVRDCDVLEQTSKTALKRDREALEQAAKAALERALKALEQVANAALERDRAALEQAAKEALQRDRAVLEQAATAALELTREALEREAREALEREAREALEREAREALEREAREALEREAREALEREAREALEREAREALEQAAKESRETLEREAREVLEQAAKAALEREKRETLKQMVYEKLEQEVREVLEQAARKAKEAREALEQEARDVLEQAAKKRLERVAMDTQQAHEVLEHEACEAPKDAQEAHEVLDQTAKETLEQETREVLDEAAMEDRDACNMLDRRTKEALEQEACEVQDAQRYLERAVVKQASREAPELESWDALGMKAHAKDGEVPIHLQSSSVEDHHENELLPGSVPSEKEYISGSKRTIAGMLDIEGKTQQFVEVLSKCLPVLCAKAHAHIEPFGMSTLSSEESMNEPLPADSSECLDDNPSLISGALSETCTVSLTEPLTPVNNGPPQETKHITIECTSATVCLDPPASGVYSAINQGDDESCSTLVEKVSSLVLEHYTTDPEKVAESFMDGSVLSSSITVGNPKEILKGSCFTVHATVPSSIEKHIECYFANASSDLSDVTPCITAQAVQETFVDEYQLLTETNDTSEGVRSTDSPVQPASLVCSPSDSPTPHTSTFVLPTKDSFTIQNQTISYRSTLTVDSSEGFGNDADLEKSSQKFMETVCSSNVEGKVLQECVANDLCTDSAASSSLHSIQEQRLYGKLPLDTCRYFVKGADEDLSQTVQDCGVVAAVVLRSDVEKQLICCNELSAGTTQISTGSLILSGSHCNAEFIASPGSSEHEGQTANCLCHKQNVCSSSSNISHLNDEKSVIHNEFKQLQILSMKHEKVADSICHSAPDMNKQIFLKGLAQSLYLSDSLPHSQLVSQASVREQSELEELKPLSEGLQTQHLKAAGNSICSDYEDHISAAHQKAMDSCDTLAVQNTMKVSAFTAFCSKEPNSTAVNVSTFQNTEDEAKSVTYRSQCAGTAIKCSKEDALNQSLCSTLPLISCVLDVETPSAVEAEESFSDSSSCEHEKCHVRKMHPKISRAIHATLHPENTVSEAVVPQQSDLGTDMESSSDIILSVLSQLKPSSTNLLAGASIGGITAKLYSPLGDLCLESAVECSRLVASNEGLELDKDPSNNSIEKPLICCAGDQELFSAIETNLPKLFEKVTVSKKDFTPGHVQDDCTTSTVENTKQQSLISCDQLNIAELKPSHSHSLAKSSVCESLVICNNNISNSSTRKNKAIVVDSLQEDDFEHKVKKARKQSKSRRWNFFPERRQESMILLKSPSSNNVPFPAAAALQANGQYGSTLITEFKMSCKQFLTDLKSSKYDLSKDMLPLDHPTRAAAVESTLHPSVCTHFQSKSVLANVSDTMEYSLGLLKVCVQQDGSRATPSNIEVHKILPAFSDERHLECRSSMGTIKECSVSGNITVPSESVKVNAMQRRLSSSNGQCQPTQNYHLDPAASFTENRSSPETTFYKPCLAGSRTQKICNTHAEHRLETDCNLAPIEASALPDPEEAVCQEWRSRDNFKQKRMCRVANKPVSGALSFSVKESIIKQAPRTQLKGDNVMQIVCSKAEPTSTSTKAVTLSRRSQKINSFCVPETVTEVKQPVACRRLASMSTLQITKRPKIVLHESGTQPFHSDAPSLSGNANRCHLSHTTAPPKNSPPASVLHGIPESGNMVKCDELRAFEGGRKLSRQLMLKKQPERRCKIVPPPESLRALKKMKPRSSLSCLSASQNSLSQQPHTILHTINRTTPMLVSEAGTERLTCLVAKQRFHCRYQNCLKFRKSTKEVALLDRLSIIANNLLLPSQSSHTINPSLPSSSKSVMLPNHFRPQRSNRLLEIFSCIKMRINSHFGSSWSSMLSKDNPMPSCNQPMALYPAGSSQVHCMNLGSSGSSIPFGTPVFPISFHIKLDSRHLLDFAKPPSHRYDPVRWEPDSISSQPSEWTLSFFLSQSSSAIDASTVFREDFHLAGELKPRALCLWSRDATDSTHERGRSSLSRLQPGCSMHGLHTVLALSSPGCYRFWTRRRNLGSRIPTVQRLFMAQFAQGLKGMRAQTPISDEPFSSLPYSLGQVLSTWSQHGVSVSPPLPTDVSLNSWQPPVDFQFRNGQFTHMHLPCVNTAEVLGHCFRNLPDASALSLTPIPGLVPALAPSPLEHFTSQLQAHTFDDISSGDCVQIQNTINTKSKVEEEKKPQRVSQIRIRRTIPKQDFNLTPMGLPRPKRLKKKEFSLEEIYTNKNYKSPPAARSLETIFEEPKEKNGALVAVSQQKRKRVLEFQDFTVPRKRKAKGKVNVVGISTRGRRATLEGGELDALLIQKLMDLEIFLAEEEARETVCGQ